jgi:hypothetical protein
LQFENKHNKLCGQFRVGSDAKEFHEAVFMSRPEPVNKISASTSSTISTVLLAIVTQIARSIGGSSARGGGTLSPF